MFKMNFKNKYTHIIHSGPFPDQICESVASKS